MQFKWILEYINEIVYLTFCCTFQGWQSTNLKVNEKDIILHKVVSLVPVIKNIFYSFHKFNELTRGEYIIDASLNLKPCLLKMNKVQFYYAGIILLTEYHSNLKLNWYFVVFYERVFLDREVCKVFHDKVKRSGGHRVGGFIKFKALEIQYIIIILIIIIFSSKFSCSLEI